MNHNNKSSKFLMVTSAAFSVVTTPSYDASADSTFDSPITLTVENKSTNRTIAGETTFSKNSSRRALDSLKKIPLVKAEPQKSIKKISPNVKTAESSPATVDQPFKVESIPSPNWDELWKKNMIKREKMRVAYGLSCDAFVARMQNARDDFKSQFPTMATPFHEGKDPKNRKPHEFTLHREINDGFLESIPEASLQSKIPILQKSDGTLQSPSTNNNFRTTKKPNSPSKLLSIARRTNTSMIPRLVELKQGDNGSVSQMWDSISFEPKVKNRNNKGLEKAAVILSFASAATRELERVKGQCPGCLSCNNAHYTFVEKVREILERSKAVNGKKKFSISRRKGFRGAGKIPISISEKSIEDLGIAADKAGRLFRSCDNLDYRIDAEYFLLEIRQTALKDPEVVKKTYSQWLRQSGFFNGCILLNKDHKTATSVSF